MEDYLQKLGLNLEFPFILTIAGLIWARVLSMMSVIPILFGRPTPRMTRLGASVVLTAFVYPILAGVTGNPGDIGPLPLFALFLKEILFGLILGFSASMIFYGFQAAGQMIDNQRGVSLARILIPELGEQASITSNFLFQFSVVLFLLLGGHRIFLKGFMESFLAVPLLEFPQTVEGLYPMIDLFMVMTGKVLFISVQIAAPVIIAILMADIILGVANRFAPQINVWELGFNIRGYLGILILFLSIAFIASQFEKYTEESLQNTEQVIKHFKGEKPPEVLEEGEGGERFEIPHPVLPIPKSGE